MPLYTVSAKQQLAPNIRQPIAQTIVDTHCELTGAPATFVNVIFWESFPLRDNIDFHLLYAVRKGRSQDDIALLKHELVTRLCKLLGVVKDSLDVEMIEIDASWVMEGGHVLPEPGEEQNCAWLHDN